MARDLNRRDWQVAVRGQVRDVLNAVLRAANQQVAFEVQLVWNITNRRVQGSPTRYSVQLSSVQASRKIRDAFSGFFRRVNPLARPPNLINVSIRNKVTLATRVRLAILRQLGSNYKEKNPGAIVSVRGFEPRPLLSLTPPPTAEGRPRTFTFIDAVSTLPASLTDNQLLPIFRIIGTNFRGELSALFCILKDDDHDRILALLRQQDRRQQPQLAQQVPVGQPVGAQATFAGVVEGAGAGMEVNAGVIVQTLMRPPPPPPPPLPAQPQQIESPSVQGSPRISTRLRQSGSSKRRRSSTPRSKRSRKSRRSRRSSTSSSSSSSSSSTSTSSSSASSNES